MNLCGAPHENGQTCHLDGNHEMHVAGFGSMRVMWPNADYVKPPPRIKTMTPAERRDAEAALRAMAEGVEPVRRSVGVLPDDPRGRREGSDAAFEALEPEFHAAAMEEGRRLQGRWTADDLWDALEDRGEVTAHPKAMAGLLRRLIRENVIKPVSKADPDAYRRPRRSNESRLLRTYEAQGAQGAPVPVSSFLRNFD